MDRLIKHLKLRFIAEKLPPSRIFTEVALMAAEESGKYFLDLMIRRERSLHSFTQLELTVPCDREYISGMVEGGDLSAGTEIRGVPKKAISYP